MAAYFIDSSALVKRYVQESGTQWVRKLTRYDSLNEIYLVRVTAVEVTSAVVRRREEKRLTRSRASSILYRFRKHFAGRYAVAEVTSTLVDSATKLVNKHSLRAYDAIQLAAAIEANRFYQLGGTATVTFVSSDKNLNKAAIAEGLKVENPNEHI